MAQDSLAIFDTPPSRNEIRLGLTIVALLLIVSVSLLPFRDQAIGETAAFLPSVYSIIFVGELIIATMLYSQAGIFRSRALVILASGFALNAFLLVPYLLTFPGIFAPSGLFNAGINSAAWIMACRRLVFPTSVAIYALMQRRETGDGPPLPDRPVHISTGLFCAIALAAVVMAIAIVGEPLLPPLFQNRIEGSSSNLLVFNLVNLALTVIAAVMLIFRARQTLLNTWLLVSLALWLVQSVLNLPLQARFTLGWYSLQLTILVAHLCVLVALIADSNRLYARLAVSTARERRERDARLMSMDAVAAAISHEVGQPLTSVTLNAAAGLQWLTQTPPRPDKAILALQETMDAGRRTFDVISSVRQTFRKGSGSLESLDVNDLISGTAAIFERELAAEKVKLKLILGDALSPIAAHRVQIQRVLINLLTNAMQALRSSIGDRKQITVQTSMDGVDTVLISVADNGAGIPPEKLPHIFEPFFTTKSSGTGLGLSLSRTIVEEHGGRMSALSTGTGAIFEIRLPLCGTSF